MSNTLVSVIIPAYNAVKTLRATITSAANQTVADLEIIIIDDGSTDGTLALAESMTDPRVRVISQENRGAAAARNTGIRAATGRYVALLDADDVWLPHKLERQLAILQGDKTIFAVQSGAIFVNDALEILSVRRCAPSRNALLETLLFKNMPNTMSTLVVARAKLDEIGYFDEGLEILEEWDMLIKVARHCNLASIREALSLYRVHAGNRSRNLAIHVSPGHLVLQRFFSDPSVPDYLRLKKDLIYARFYTMLAGAAFQMKLWPDFLHWTFKAASAHPTSLVYMAALPARVFTRFISRKRGT